MSQATESLSKDLDRAMKKQKIAQQRSVQSIDDMIAEIRKAQGILRSDDPANAEVPATKTMSDLLTTVKKLDCQEEVKDLQTHVIMFGKTAEKVMMSDLTKAHRPIAFDPTLVNEVIAGHLYRQGRFHIADTFAQESKITIPESIKAPFMDLYTVLEAIRNKNLDVPLQWAIANRDKLSEISSDVEFRIHRLKYIQLLSEKKNKEALQYARINFHGHSEVHLEEIQRVMGAIPYLSRLEASPYADLFSPENWIDLSQTFVRDACMMMDIPHDSPLYTSICAGTIALPTLLKLASVMSGKTSDWNTSDKLSVEINLGRNYQYHSVLTCPVSRELTTEENPPMALVCGHIIAKQSIQKLAKGSMRFKCPYCPVEQLHSQAKQIFL